MLPVAYYIAFALHSAHIACTFLYPLLPVRHIQLFTPILILEALKAQVQPYDLVLKPVDSRSKTILYQFVIMPAAFISVADIQNTLLCVGQTQGL